MPRPGAARRVGALALGLVLAASACGGSGGGGGGDSAVGGGGGDRFTPKGGTLIPIANVSAVASAGGRLWVLSSGELKGLEPEAFEIDKDTGSYTGLQDEDNVLVSDLEYGYGGGPNSLTAGDGMVWAADAGPTCLNAIDPDSGKRTSKVDPSDTKACAPVSYGHDAVWSVSLGNDNSFGLNRIKDEKVSPVELPGEGFVVASVGPDAVYAVKGTTLHRIDPETLEVTKSADVGLDDARYGVVATPDGVWVTDWDSPDGDVAAQRFDLESLEVVGSISGSAVAKAGDFARPPVYHSGGVWTLSDSGAPLRWDASAGDDGEIERWNGLFEGQDLGVAGGELYILGGTSLVWYDLDDHEVAGSKD